MAHQYILACVVFIFCWVDGESLYGLKGLSVSLKPGVPGKPTDILWKYNGNKLVEFDGNEEHVYGTFKNRITLDWHTADIVINDLRFEDSGNYELEATINNKLHRLSKTLVVIEEVPKPTISCKMNDGSSSNKSGTLECSAESKDSQTQFLMKFEWKSHGNVQPGPQLTISLGDEHDDHEYICNVSNPMSSETTTFTAKDCYPDKGSSVALAAALAIVFSLLGLGIVVLGIVFCHRTHKACFAVRGDDVQEQSPLTEKISDNHKTTSQDEENMSLLHTTAANQPPDMTFSVGERIKMFEGKKGSDGKMNKGKAPPIPPRSKFDKGDQLREPAEAAQSDPTDPEKANQPDPAVVLADLEEDKKPHQESSTAPEEPGLETTLSESEPAKKEGAADEPADSEDSKKPHQESSTAPEDSELKKEAEKDEEANFPSNSVSPSAKALLPLTQNSPNEAPENTAGEQSQDMDKPVSEPENKPVNEEIDEEKDLYGDTSQQPQSPIPTKPNNEHTNTLQESPEAAHKTPDQEKMVKTTQDSVEFCEDEDESVQCGPKEEKPDQ